MLNSDYVFDGLIDEFVVFKDILTVDEIDLIRQGAYPPPVNVQATTQSFELVTYPAGVLGATTINASCANLAITTYPADVGIDTHEPTVVSASSEPFILSAHPADVFYGNPVPANAAALILTTYAADVHVMEPADESIIQTAMIWDAVTITWIKSVSDDATIADEVSFRLGIPVEEWLNIKDAVTSRWFGSMSVTDTLHAVGQAVIVSMIRESVTDEANISDAVSTVQRMFESVESSMQAADAVDTKVFFKPDVVETVAISALVSAIKSLNLSVEETVLATDSLGIGWMVNVEDTAAIADTVSLRLAAMLLITESLIATDVALASLNILESVSETLNASAVATIQQFLQENVIDTVHISVEVELDGELWECWVMNSNNFNMSVYSGFDFNSYAVYNSTAYGCRADGIYKLSGDTDNGAAISAGIILPETDFGSSSQKRFRKAFFGISGSTPSLRMETENGSVTYNIVNSRANIQRNQKAHTWVVKIADFNDIDFIELVPVVLTRR